MNAARLREQVRTRLSAGALPRASVTTVVAGYGRAADDCAACGGLIRTSEVEYKLNFPEAAAPLHMHYYCFVVWERERLCQEETVDATGILRSPDVRLELSKPPL